MTHAVYILKEVSQFRPQDNTRRVAVARGRGRPPKKIVFLSPKFKKLQKLEFGAGPKKKLVFLSPKLENLEKYEFRAGPKKKLVFLSPKLENLEKFEFGTGSK